MWLVCTNAIWKKKKKRNTFQTTDTTHTKIREELWTAFYYKSPRPSSLFFFFKCNSTSLSSLDSPPPIAITATFLSPSPLSPLETNGHHHHQFFSFYSRSDRDTSITICCGRKEDFFCFVRPSPDAVPGRLIHLLLLSLLNTTPDGLPILHPPEKRKTKKTEEKKRKKGTWAYTHRHIWIPPPLSTHSTPVPISNLIIDDEMARARDDCVWSHPRNGHKRPRIYHYTTMQCYSPVTTNPRGGSPVYVEWLVGSPSANGRLWFSRSGGLQYGPVFIACTNAIDLYFLFLFSLSFSVHFNCLYKFLEKRCNRFEMFETIVAYCWRFVGLIFIFIFWCVRALFFKRVFSTSTRRLGKGQSSSLKKLSGIPIEAPPNRVNPRRKANSTIEKIMFN